MQILRQLLQRLLEPIELRFRWNGAPITVYCSAVWTTIHRLARTTTERPTLSSGLHIESVAALARKTLDAMLESLRANRAQTAAYTQNSSSSTTIGPYLFCEFRNGEWRQSRTFTREQPGEGFTLSATEDAGQVARLCAAYAGGDGDTRKLIRTLAALSLKSQSDELATV